MLSTAERLNCRCDEAAKELLRNTWVESGPRPDLLSIPSVIYREGLLITVGHVKVTSDPHDPVLYHLSAKDMKAYLAKHNLLLVTTFDKVDWEAMGRMLA